jgi:hypothetical protein
MAVRGYRHEFFLMLVWLTINHFFFLRLKVFYKPYYQKHKIILDLEECVEYRSNCFQRRMGVYTVICRLYSAFFQSLPLLPLMSWVVAPDAGFLFDKTSVLCSKASRRLIRLKLLIIGRNGISTACNKYLIYPTSHNALRWQHTYLCLHHLPWPE